MAAGLLCSGLGGGDAVDREESEFAHQVLVVHAAQRGVVDDALRARHVGCEAGEAVDGSAGFAAGSGDPFDIEDDPAVHVGRARGDKDKFGAPGGVAVAFEVERRVGFVARRKDLAGLAVHAMVVGLGLEEGSDDLAVCMDHPAEVGMGPRAGAARVEEPE